MGKRWSRLVLLLLAVVLVSVQCCHAVEGEGLEEGVVHSDFEDDDDLEDLEEGLDADSGDTSAAEAAMAATKVANVNDQDAQRVIAKFDYVMLLGYAPWCTQSQALLPEFAAAAALLSRLGNPTVLAKLDAINNPNAASLYQIRGFPTLMFFANGAREEYFGGHSRCTHTRTLSYYYAFF
jgi:protein disulfide-isomerase A1